MSPSPVNSLCPYVASTPYPVPYNGNSPSPANSLYPCVASTLIPSRTMGTLLLLPIHCVLISLDPKSRPIWVETKVKTVLIDVREKEIQYLWSGWPCSSATAWCPDVTLRDIRT